MLSSTVNPITIVLRNYAIAATTVLALSLGVSDLLNVSPHKTRLTVTANT